MPEAIRRGREKSSRVPLAALGVISPWNPLATLSFHQENSAIAEGLVPLRGPGLGFTGFGVLCLRYRPSAYSRCCAPDLVRNPIGKLGNLVAEENPLGYNRSC